MKTKLEAEPKSLKVAQQHDMTLQFAARKQRRLFSSEAGENRLPFPSLPHISPLTTRIVLQRSHWPTATFSELSPAIRISARLLWPLRAAPKIGHTAEHRRRPLRRRRLQEFYLLQMCRTSAKCWWSRQHMHLWCMLQLPGCPWHLSNKRHLQSPTHRRLSER